MVRVSRKNGIHCRVIQLKRRVKIDTQRIRSNLLKHLEEIFNLAASLAKGDIKTMKVGDKRVKVSLKQRQMWAKVAAYTAQIMNSIAQGFDEREIDVQLDELERLVNEARAKAEIREA